MTSSESSPTAQIIADLLVRVYEIHERIIARTGGIEGMRDPAALHGAVARPFATFANQDLYPDDFEKAAALFHSLVKSHPFMDGTKRTAFASTLYFLEVYGHPRSASLPEDEVIGFCLDLAEENARQARGEPVQPKTIAEIAAWFRSLLAPQMPT
jgi:death on curing protein